MKIGNIERARTLIGEREDLLEVHKTMQGKSCHFMAVPHYGTDGFNNGVHLEPELNERFMQVVKARLQEIEEELKDL